MVTTRRRSRPVARRRGTILVLSAVMLIVMVALLALSIDIGYICLAQSELARSVDAAALAGAGALSDGQASAESMALEYLVRNPLGKVPIVVEDEELAAMKTKFLEDYGDELEFGMGHWNADTGSFAVDSSAPSALRVAIRYPDRKFFFAPVLGYKSFSVEAEAIAMYQPRDIMLVLDYSASMNDDSELGSIDRLGKDHIVGNIQAMWQDLGSPTYGNMGFEPDYVTIPGETLPASVRWRGTEVDLSSTENMDEVRVYRSDGYYKAYYNQGTSGTLSYSDNLLYKCKIKIDGVWETYDFWDDSDMRRGLGLDGVTYPSSGSWDDYIDYARNHSSSMSWYDRDVYDAGYRRKFGALTLINFWNKNKPMASQTPDLHKVCAQPIHAVKNSVDLFVNYVAAVDADDRVGLAVYNSDSGVGKVESGLTYDLDLVAQIMRARQAGHYHRYTNIADGLKEGREELENSGREGALKMIVLMTDGMANWTASGYSTSTARDRVFEEADLCAAKKIPIVTISLGAGADWQLMDDVSEITESVHFNIPGGSTVQAYSAELLEVFRQIATARPLRLVH